MNITILDGKRDGSRIYTCRDGFYYHYNNGNNYAENEGNGSVLYMRCINYNSRHCCGSAKVELTPDGAQWINLRHHSCAPDQLYERVMRLRSIVRAATDKNGPYETASMVVDRIRNRLVCIPSQSSVYMTSISNLLILPLTGFVP